MSFCIVHDDGKTLIATERRLIKAGERAVLGDACALLARVRDIEEQMRLRHAETEREAKARGLQEGREEGRRAFVAAIERLLRDVRNHRQAEEREIAALALAALRRMIDDIGDDTMMIGIARRAVSAVTSGGETIVHVAPELCDAISAAMEPEGAGITVRSDPALALHECRVMTGEGRIIADLAVQLAAIEGRWSMADVD